jgi:hypothetical protein
MLCSPYKTSKQQIIHQHRDVGFANTAANIVNEYFDIYFPAVPKIVDQLQQAGLSETRVFTTHPFLVWLYLNCYTPRAGPPLPQQSGRAEFYGGRSPGTPSRSTQRWSFTTLPWQALVSISWTYKLFGRNSAITMSQRDVPGMTRSVIPLLVSNGVQAITVGVNTVSMPPAVPSVFRWQDPVSQTEVVAMWHPHGYGGQNGPSLDSVVTVPRDARRSSFCHSWRQQWSSECS